MRKLLMSTTMLITWREWRPPPLVYRWRTEPKIDALIDQVDWSKGTAYPNIGVGALVDA